MVKVNHVKFNSKKFEVQLQCIRLILFRTSQCEAKVYILFASKLKIFRNVPKVHETWKQSLYFSCIARVFGKVN